MRMCKCALCIKGINQLESLELPGHLRHFILVTQSSVRSPSYDQRERKTNIWKLTDRNALLQAIQNITFCCSSLPVLELLSR